MSIVICKEHLEVKLNAGTRRSEILNSSGNWIYFKSELCGFFYGHVDKMLNLIKAYDFFETSYSETVLDDTIIHYAIREALANSFDAMLDLHLPLGTAITTDEVLTFTLVIKICNEDLYIDIKDRGIGLRDQKAGLELCVPQTVTSSKPKINPDARVYFGGLGVALKTCKTLIGNIGGSVTLKNRKMTRDGRSGLRFRITYPLSQQQINELRKHYPQLRQDDKKSMSALQAPKGNTKKQAPPLKETLALPKMRRSLTEGSIKAPHRTSMGREQGKENCGTTQQHLHTKLYDAHATGFDPDFQPLSPLSRGNRSKSWSAASRTCKLKA